MLREREKATYFAFWEWSNLQLFLGSVRSCVLAAVENEAPFSRTRTTSPRNRAPFSVRSNLQLNAFSYRVLRAFVLPTRARRSLPLPDVARADGKMDRSAHRTQRPRAPTIALTATAH
jgi:hypothetical protein